MVLEKKTKQPDPTTIKHILLRNIFKGMRTRRVPGIDIALGQEKSLLFLGAKLGHRGH